jgi:hypothetical protein
MEKENRRDVYVCTGIIYVEYYSSLEKKEILHFAI